MLDPIIKIKDMSIIYNKGKENEFRASDNINADIYPGEYIIFFGPSGCGKSTVLYSVLGVLRPTAGHVIVKGEDIYSYDANQLVRYQTRTIGIMYQAFYLISSLTIADNVTLPMIFEGIHPTIRRKRALELLNRFGIGQHAYKLPEALSGGQMQRVSVARAFINDPEILLADEPVGNLDSISTEQVMSTLKRINDEDKKTILLVTHDAKHLPYAHRVIHIKDGHIARIVPNPEKTQIAKVDQQKNLITEMETLVKIHPYLTPSELKVKSIVNYLTQDVSFEQLQRLEDFSKLVIDGVIDSHKFLRLLVQDYKKGGLGLHHDVARNMTYKIDKILTESKDFRRYRRRMEENNFFDTDKDLLKKLVRHVESECPQRLKAEAQKNFNDLVYGRASGLIKKEEFHDTLIKSPARGGAGLGIDIADNLTIYFEKIIMQGLSTDEKAGH